MLDEYNDVARQIDETLEKLNALLVDARRLGCVISIQTNHWAFEPIPETPDSLGYFSRRVRGVPTITVNLSVSLSAWPSQ